MGHEAGTQVGVVRDPDPDGSSAGAEAKQWLHHGFGLTTQIGASIGRRRCQLAIHHQDLPHTPLLTHMSQQQITVLATRVWLNLRPVGAAAGR